MKRLLKNTSLLLIGSVFGWWLHDIGITDAELPVQFPGSSSNNRVALVDQKLPLDFPHRDRVVDNQNPFRRHVGVPIGPLSRAAYRIALELPLDRSPHIVQIDNQHRGAVIQNRSRIDVGDLAKPRVERPLPA